MKLPKTNKNLFFCWLILGIAGYLLSYVVIKPMMHTWPASYQFTDDLPYNLYKLLVAEILLLPGIAVNGMALISSLNRKQFRWSAVHMFGLLLLVMSVIYFALPIVFPAHGL